MFNFKTIMMTGTAVIALGVSGAAAQTSLTGDSTYGTTAPVNAPTAGINIDLQGFNLTVDNTNNTDIGAITDTGGTPDGNITIQSSAASDLSQTIGSIDNGTGNFTMQNTANDANLTVTVTNGFDIGGNLVVNSSADATSPDVLTLTVGGNTTVAGTTAIDAGNNGTGLTQAIVDLNGATNLFTGTVTVTGGDTNGSDIAFLNISGTTTTFTGGLTLTNGAAGRAELGIDGTTAQTINGAIAGNGTINVTNTDSTGVIIADDMTHTGTFRVNNDGNNQAIAFGGNVTSAVTLGDNSGTDTVTATFNSGDAATVNGVISGGGAADTVALVFSGGSTITLSGAATTNIDTVRVSGNSTLDSDAAITATTITVDSGSTLDQGAGAINAAIANNGTLQITGAGAITGNISGTGALDIDTGATLSGSVTQGSADIALVTVNQGAASGYNVGTTNFSGNGTFNLSSGTQTVTGNFTNTTDGQGNVTVADGAGTTTISGNIGTAIGNSLASFDVQGATAQTVTLSGNLYADSVFVNDNDTLQFVGGTQNVSGTITNGIITVGNGTSATRTTFNGAITSASAINVLANATAIFAANATTTGAYTNTGSTNVGVGYVVSADSFTDTGTYTLSAADGNSTLETSDFGSLTDTTPGSTISPTNLAINLSGDMATGTVQLLTGINTGAGTLTDNSAIYSFAVADNGANTDVTVTKTTISSVAAGTGTGVGATNTTNVAAVFDTLAGTSDPQLAQVNNSLASASTAEDIAEVLEATTPTVDAGAVVAANIVTNQAVGITNTRLASLRDNTPETGMVAGNVSSGLRAWGQFFGTSGDQDTRDGIDGYDVDSYGLVVGIDTENIADHWIWGLAFAYASTDVESRNANNTQTDIDSYQISLYSNLDLDKRTYLSGQLGYVFGSNEQTRSNVGGVSGLNADGDFDSDIIMARLEAGRRYMVGANTTLTPRVSMNYQHYSAEGYTEAGAGGANLVVDSESMNMFELGAAIDASWDYQQADGAILQPKLTAGVRHDLIGDEFETTSRFSGGGASFETTGFEPAQTTFNLGADLTYFNTANWELKAGYDFEFKEDYDAHTGTLEAAYRF